MPQQTFVGLHVPKCAGTSFLDMATALLPPNAYYQNTSIIKNWQSKRPEFFDILDYSALRLVWGHSVHEQMLHFLTNPVLFTGMRDPVDRLKSHARYEITLSRQQGRDFDVHAWLPQQRNPICWFIINRFPILADRANPALTPFEKARNALKNFNHVYLTENFDQSVDAVFTAMGVARQEVRRSNIGKADIEVDIDINAENLLFDIELYKWVQDTFGASEFDPEKPIPASLVKFLAGTPMPRVLERFLFRNQAGEYKGWNVVDKVIDDRVKRATRLLNEVEVYRGYR